MRFSKRSTCAAVLCLACLPIALVHAAGQQPEGDVDALLFTLAEAVRAGKKTFAVPPAVYRFGRHSFELKNVRDMEIDGQGSTFLFALRGGRVHLQSCRNVTLKNLYLDMEHPRSSRGPSGRLIRPRKRSTFPLTMVFPPWTRPHFRLVKCAT